MDLLENRYIAIDSISPKNVSLNPCDPDGGGTAYRYILDVLTGSGQIAAIFDGVTDIVSGFEAPADGRNVILQNKDDYFDCSGGSATCNKFKLGCTAHPNSKECKKSPATKVKTREWRQLFMR
jgi:hypothetical protein